MKTSRRHVLKQASLAAVGAGFLSRVDKVAAMQDRLNALGRESAKPLALMYVGSVGLAHGKPRMASEDGKGAVMVEADGHAITDEGVGDPEAEAAHH